MAYIGRVVGVGATVDGNPVLLYGLSGRSPSSRARIASIHGSRVSIEPYGEMTSEQLAEAQRLIYDAIMVSNFFKFGVVSNGKQTGDISRLFKKRELLKGLPFYTVPNHRYAISEVLKKWGHEGKVGDKYNTPRIAGIVEANAGKSHLGIIAGSNENRSNIAVTIYTNRGCMDYLSTYTGEGSEPEAPVFYAVGELIENKRIESRIVKDLAQEMYDFMDPEFVVSSAAALFVSANKKWELAVGNKAQ